MLLLTFLAACGFQADLVDDLGPTEEIHLPWLPGSTPTLVGEIRGPGSEDTLALDTIDPNVVELVDWTLDGDALTIDLKAVGAGSTDLRIKKAESGKVLQTVPLEVAEPDGFRLLPSADVFQGKDEFVREPTIVAGGLATFLVQLQRGKDVIYSDAGLDDGDFGAVAPRDGMTAEYTPVLAGVEGRWLRLQADDQGDHPVVLEPVKGVELEVVVHAVLPVAVSEIKLVKPDEEAAEKGDELHVALRAFDFEDGELYGAPVEWEVDGKPFDALDGHTLRYRYQPKQRHEAVVRIANIDARAEFHGKIIESDLPGCGCASARWTGAWPLLAMLLVARRRP